MDLLNNFRWNYRTALAVVVLGILAVCCGCMLLGGSIFSTGSDDNTDSPRVEDNGEDLEIPSPVADDDVPVDENFALGNLVSASSLDPDGCPTTTTDSFSTTDPIYIATDGSQVSAGTDVFVRLFGNGEIVEDADEITAPEDLDNVCISFVFEPDSDAAFAPGDYEAQIFVNGSLADSVTFTIE